jgi:hypothetical protein
MSLEGMEATTLRDTPNFGSSIVAARNHNITLDLQAADTGLVANKNLLANAGLDIPDPECCVPRSGDCSVRVRHLKAANCRGVTSKSIKAVARDVLAMNARRDKQVD